MDYFLICSMPNDRLRLEVFGSCKDAGKRIPDLIKEGWGVRVIAGYELKYEPITIIKEVRIQDVDEVR